MNDEVNEDPADRARKYIAKFEDALRSSTPAKDDTLVASVSVRRVSDTMDRYLRDSRYYLDANKPTTALASIAYAEGLLDALLLLNLAATER